MGYTTVAIILLVAVIMLAISSWILWRRLALIGKYLLYIVQTLKGMQGGKAKEPGNAEKTTQKTP